MVRPGGQAAAFDPAGCQAETRTFPAVFYGRGKGFHGIQHFNGRPLKDALKSFVTLDSDTLRRGYLVAASIDGYRIAMSCSELFNRNDQAEFLLVDRGAGPGRRALRHLPGRRFLFRPRPQGGQRHPFPHLLIPHKKKPAAAGAGRVSI